MRAAEILATMLLDGEAPPVIRPQGTVVIAHGPGLPKEGRYGTGPGWEEAMRKLLATDIGKVIGTNHPVREIIQVALHSGYTFFVKDLDGQVYFYGLQPAKVDRLGAQLLGLNAASQIQRVLQVGADGTPEPATDYLDKDAMGGTKPRIQPKPALQRIQKKTKFAPPTPGEEKEFLKNVPPSPGLTLTPKQPHSAEQIRKANERDAPRLAAERARQAELARQAAAAPKPKKPGWRQRFWRLGR